MKISVVIPIYNAADTILATMQSVFDQTQSPYEVLLVDDGSKDDSAGLVTEFIRQNALTTWRLISQNNAGGAAARTRGILEAKGSWIALLDADDVWHPEKLRAQAEMALQDPELALIYSKHEFIDEAGNALRERTLRTQPPVRGILGDTLLYEGNRIVASNSSALFKKDVWKNVGGYDTDLQVSEDWDLWIRLTKVEKIDYHPDPLVQIRVRPQSISSDWFRMIEGDLRVLSKYSSDIAVLRSYLKRASRKNLAKLILSVRFRRLSGRIVPSRAVFLFEILRAFVR